MAKRGKGMLSSVEQAFVGREEIRAPLKMPAWEARYIADSKISTLEGGLKKLRIRLLDSPDTSGRKPYPERKSCGFNNIRAPENGAYEFVVAFERRPKRKR